jgi:hypothetical protein
VPPEPAEPSAAVPGLVADLAIDSGRRVDSIERRVV